jgi:hypothetical protein
MLLIRDVFHCKPGKVRPLLDKFHAMDKLMQAAGQGKSRLMTDFAAEKYWTLVSEYEVPSMQAFEEMMAGKGFSEEDNKAFEKIMEGYHDLIVDGRREIFRIEEPKP